MHDPIANFTGVGHAIAFPAIDATHSEVSMQLPGFRMRHVLLGHAATFFIIFCAKREAVS